MPETRPLSTAVQIDVLCDQFDDAWRAGARPRIEDFLRPFEDADRSALLRELLVSELEWRARRAERPEIADYLARFPDYPAVVREVFDERPTLVARVFRAASSPSPINTEPDETVGTAAISNVPGTRALPAVPGFEIVSELGRGGMGVVYLARNHRLPERHCALKMILAGSHASPEAVARLQAEAKTISRLVHPHVAQLYSAGDHEGRPYLELEYVAGGSLQQRLDGRPRSAVEAAELIEDVARGVAEAHRLGIVHRDLKPANILMASDGTPKVVDFGLAKRLDPEAGPALTRSEAVIGTPSYMAPEQCGEARAVGPPADVYSLGAILYELLTGRPPFRAATAIETLELARSAEVIAPGRLVPGLPRDLETIALKCLEKEPKRRYASAAELAADIRRFQESRPISARRTGALFRAQLWCRRNPAVASLTIALAFVLAGGLLGIISQWRRAEANLQQMIAANRAVRGSNAELKAANDRERTARIRAQQRLGLAMDSVKAVAAGTRSDLLGATGGDRRTGRLGVALGLLSKLMDEAQADAGPRAGDEVVPALMQVAGAAWEFGARDEALAAYRRALAFWEKSSAADPRDLGRRHQAAQCLAAIALLQREQGRAAESIVSNTKAAAIWNALAHDRRSDEFLDGLGWCHGNLGAAFLELGRLETALSHHEQARALFQELVKRHPDNSERRASLAWMNLNIGAALGAAGRPRDALKLVSDASAMLESISQSEPRNSAHRALWTDSVMTLAAIHQQLGQNSQARSHFERAVAERRQQARANPKAVNLQSKLAEGLLALGDVQYTTDRPDDALRSYRLAMAEWESLSKQQPDSPVFRGELAWAMHKEGCVLRDQGHLAQALRKSESAARILESLHRAHSTELRPAERLVSCLRDLAACHSLANQLVKAEAVLRRALPAAHDLMIARGSHPNDRRLLSAIWDDLGMVLRERGQAPAGNAAFARALLHQSIAFAHDLRVDPLRRFCSEHLGRLTIVQRHRGRPLDAVRTALLRGRLWPSNATEQYNVACELALCVHLIKTPDHAMVVADRAMEILKGSVKLGFKDVYHIRRDPDLDALRSRADFTTLLSDLSFPADPFVTTVTTTVPVGRNPVSSYLVPILSAKPD
jgi:tetratricopeptide (TPR) repeat protein